MIKRNTSKLILTYLVLLCGSMTQWLAHLEFELGGPGLIPGSCHYSIE